MEYFKWIKDSTYYLKGTKVIITGAAGGIGYHVTKYLAFLEAHVIMAVRNIKRAETVKEQVMGDVPNAKIDILELDVTSFKSIDRFVEIVMEKYPDVSVLINNAGVYRNHARMIENEIEIHFMTNFVGPLYLIEKMLPMLNKNPKSNIINISSLAYYFNEIDFDDIQSLNTPKQIKVYGRTKRLMLLATLFMQRNYRDTFSNVHFSLVHPGISATSLFYGGNSSASRLFKRVVVPIMKLIFMSPAKAALPIIAAVYEEEMVVNAWLGPRGLFQVWGYPKQFVLSEKVIDAELQERAYLAGKNFFPK